MFTKDKDRPLYVISVVAEMLGVHPQTLRLYEREGFIAPTRSNKQRMYSDDDIDELSFILNLTKNLGVNKAGLEIILPMRRRMQAFQDEMEQFMVCLEDDYKRELQERLKRVLQEVK
ncbi:MAG: MerR family transcriptional regulator [Nitrospirae bacterium]|nr:MerR family transcriptional regulator [Nitrospirota bacterium]MBF0534762.1 MerR family transcriptional regulator [Nitrospirota bacterium]MBF0616436.1 MerR family transcriptional regulator [Nitrospirota bacterium]